MFNLDHAISEWRKQMSAGGIKTPTVLDELECHLRDDIEQQMRSGITAQSAFESAVQQIGQPRALKIEFAKVDEVKWALRRKLKSILMKFIGWGNATPFPPLSNFDASARATLELAQKEPARFHHDFIGTEHVLLSLLKSDTGVVPNVMRKMAVDGETVRKEIEKIVGIGPVHEAAAAIPYTPRARNALHLAAKEARALNHAHIGNEHIFLGLLLESDGVAGLVLRNLGIHIDKTRQEILKELATA
jgi:Clp amino terminal domain, pathogenicity island component